MIELRKITHDNFYEVTFDLKVTKEQEKYIGSNAYALALAYVDITNDDKPVIVFAIYNDNTPIGLVEIGYYTLSSDSYLTKKYGDKTTYGINHYMIDHKYQGKGLGKQAMLKIIDYLKTYPLGKADAISLSYWYMNDPTRKFYQSVGFEETGDIWDGDSLEAWDTSRDDYELAEVGARFAL